MSKIRIEFECNGDAKEFFDRVIEDYYQTAKNCDQETLEQYESVNYEIQDLDPALNCECGYQH